MGRARSLSETDRQHELLGRIELLKADAVARWGLMNAPEMVCHLSGAFRMVMKPGRVEPRRSWLRGPIGRWFVLRAPVPWPHGYPTVPELDMKRRRTVVRDFEARRARLLRELRGFCQARDEQLLAAHPFLGRMKREDWMRWGYRHTDHHLRQFGC